MIDEGDEETARALLEANYEAVTEQLEMGVEGVEQAAMLVTLTQLRMSLRDLDGIEDLPSQMKQLADKIDEGPGPQPLPETILDNLPSMTAIGRQEDSLPLFRRSIEIQEDLLGSDSPLLVKTLLGLAGKVDEAEVSMRRALEIVTKLHGEVTDVWV